MKVYWIAAPALLFAVTVASPTRLNAQIFDQQGHQQGFNDQGDHQHFGQPFRQQEFRFLPGTLVLSRSVYVGKASTVTIGETLPLGCEGGLTGDTVNVPLIAGGTTPVVVPCGVRRTTVSFPTSSIRTTYGTTRTPTPASA